MLSNFNVMPTLPSADLGAAKAFYQGLGFTTVDSPASEAPEEVFGVVFSAGSTKFLVYPSAYAGTNKATAMGFELDAGDFDEVLDGLRSKGITFDTFDVPDGTWDNGVLTGFGMKSAWFHDPDGNIINVGTGA
jgi:catechol 2,3-dioxygenase-like lactoylglutathione lyase family enzyme